MTKFIIIHETGYVLDQSGKYKIGNFSKPMEFDSFNDAWGHLYECYGYSQEYLKYIEETDEYAVIELNKMQEYLAIKMGA